MRMILTGFSTTMYRGYREDVRARLDTKNTFLFINLSDMYPQNGDERVLIPPLTVDKRPIMKSEAPTSLILN